jgi:hypothetical protein
VLCPRCRSGRCRRSKRRSWKDFTIGLTGLRPWRCRLCELRFFAWSVAIPFLCFAHCRLCGNLDLQRISRDHVQGWIAWFFRLLQVPAYRCAPCRRRFFSFLPHRHLRPVESQPTIPEEIEASSHASPS